MSANSVENHLVKGHPLTHRVTFTVEASCVNVLCVGKYLAIALASNNTRRFTLERNHTNAVSVEVAFFKVLTLETTIGSTLERNHLNVMCVANCLVKGPT